MTHKQTQRRETQRQQKAAEGKSLHPRGLARSVAKFINRKNSAKESDIRNFRETVGKLPKKGKKYLKSRNA